MQWQELVKKRRSIRKFLSSDISLSTIDQIIEAGLFAPSAHHQQPWEVIVLKKKKDRIASIMKDYANHHSDDISITKTADTIARCNTLLLIYCNQFDQWEYNLLSIGAMIENMLLQATDFNIGSVWIGNVCPMKEEINQLLGVESRKKRLVSAIALGYFDIKPKQLERKTVSQVTNYFE